MKGQALMVLIPEVLRQVQYNILADGLGLAEEEEYESLSSDSASADTARVCIFPNFFQDLIL
jgi:hypothetical protein